jgi:hypothetical protein
LQVEVGQMQQRLEVVRELRHFGATSYTFFVRSLSAKPLCCGAQ